MMRFFLIQKASGSTLYFWEKWKTAISTSRSKPFGLIQSLIENCCHMSGHNAKKKRMNDPTDAQVSGFPTGTQLL
jgi:hypothetical protein